MTKYRGSIRSTLMERRSRKDLELSESRWVLGLILGAGLGALAGYEPNKIITLGVNMAAVMFILPRMVRILMEGLMPLSEDAKKFLAKKFPGKEVNIGMDAAIATGSPMVISAALIMIPVTLLLAVILPGNRVLPLVDLATLPFFMIWPVVASKETCSVH